MQSGFGYFFSTSKHMLKRLEFDNRSLWSALPKRYVWPYSLTPLLQAWNEVGMVASKPVVKLQLHQSTVL